MGSDMLGQAKDFNRRHRSHINMSNNDKQKYDYSVPFHRAIRKYGIDNFEIKILAENIPTQEKIDEYEIFFIKRYKTLKTQNGYNISSGGFGGNKFAGKTDEEMNEFKERCSIRMTGKNNPMYGSNRIGIENPMYGKKHSKETKNKISEKLKGKYSGENSHNYGRKLSDETKEKIRKKLSVKIVQFDLNLNIIKIWNSAKEVNRILNIDDGDIGKCCKNKKKTCGGYKWKYLSEVDDDLLKEYIIKNFQIKIN